MSSFELKLRDALAGFEKRMPRFSAPKTEISYEPIHPRGFSDVGSLLDEAGRLFSEFLALREMDRKALKKEYSFKSYREKALQLARRFEVEGYQEGDRIAIIMGNQSDWVIAATAAFFRGMVLVPLDYKLSAEDQLALLKHAKPKALVTESHSLEKLFALSEEEKLWGKMLPWVRDWKPRGTSSMRPVKALDEASDGESTSLVKRTRDDLACIVYSSGTGGSPKGCMLSHGNYLSQLELLMELYPMRPKERWFSILPTNHAIDFLSGFIGTLASGATIVHQRSLRPEFILHTMKSQKITQMAVVPLILEAFDRAIKERLESQPEPVQNAMALLGNLNQGLTQNRLKPALSRLLLKPIHDAFGGQLKRLFVGGAFVDEALANRFTHLGIPVIIGYGLTECTTVATLQDLQPYRADSVGAPLKGIQIQIHEPNEEGIGEVWIQGPTVMMGYLEAPKLSRETLIKDPKGGSPWLRTGDLGFLDASGHLKLRGRLKNMIVTQGGKNIYPEDIEQLFRDIDAEDFAVFSETYLFPKTDSEALRLDRLLAVIYSKDPESTLEKLKKVNRSLPVGRRIHGLIMSPRALPRTASMKIKRHEVKAFVEDKLSPKDIISL